MPLTLALAVSVVGVVLVAIWHQLRPRFGERFAGKLFVVAVIATGFIAVAFGLASSPEVGVGALVMTMVILGIACSINAGFHGLLAPPPDYIIHARLSPSIAQRYLNRYYLVQGVGFVSSVAGTVFVAVLFVIEATKTRGIGASLAALCLIPVLPVYLWALSWPRHLALWLIRPEKMQSQLLGFAPPPPIAEDIGYEDLSSNTGSGGHDTRPGPPRPAPDPVLPPPPPKLLPKPKSD